MNTGDSVRSGFGTRRAILWTASLLLVALAFWIRNPPRPPLDAGAEAAADTAALLDLRATLTAEVGRLQQIADRALSAPADQPGAFDYLAALLDTARGESVMLFDSTRSIAWAGQIRVSAQSLPAPLTVVTEPFFSVVAVVRKRGGARAVAEAIAVALAPADKLGGSIAATVSRRHGNVPFVVKPPPDSGAAPGVVLLRAGSDPALSGSIVPRQTAELRFEAAQAFRARAAIGLLIGYVLLLLAGWGHRKDLKTRLGTVLFGFFITAVLPWSEFSNSSRVFDPAFYFSRVGGPFTANAGALLASIALLVLGASAVLRARLRTRVPRPVAWAASIVVAGLGIPLASNILRGVGQPVWGTSSALWLSWELPFFLLLLTIFVATMSFARLATHRRLALSGTQLTVLAVVAALAATSALWFTTTRQRIRLAERDVASLARADEYERELVDRFLSTVASSGALLDDAGLLKAYSLSELAAADFPILLETRSAAGDVIARLDLSGGGVDTAYFAGLAAKSSDGVTTILGPTGLQTVAVARYPDGIVTSAVVLPHTRIVPKPPFAALLGLGRDPATDPPYTAMLADANQEVPARQGTVAWRRLGDQWHGDALVPTSKGLRRVHLEVDLLPVAGRVERGILTVLLDLALAGLLWLAGAAAERPFVRWLRGRWRLWIHTYHARLTLALFAFFLVPSVAFAAWSYQRLRADDREARELLVEESLAAIGNGRAEADLAGESTRFGTPLFRYAGGFLDGSSDSLSAQLAPGGLALPPSVETQIVARGELTASARQSIGGEEEVFGYRAVLGADEAPYVLAAPARGDDVALNRRRRDLEILVLFSVVLAACAALFLSRLAARGLARDLELSRIEVARAERIIAWGEMARQIAHEIKNPLTPIRLGVQHLLRARRDNRGDFDKVLDESVARILAEIDRLDSTARSFSRYGSAPADLPPAERVDVTAVARDVIALEQMGSGTLTWKLRGADGRIDAMATPDELRDVLLNLFENSRLAGAQTVEVEIRQEDRRVTIEIRDDGSGIPAPLMSRVFEPHFSTRTTGSGLGLPASRRVLDHWGGEIAISSEESSGTRVLLALRKPGTA